MRLVHVVVVSVGIASATASIAAQATIVRPVSPTVVFGDNVGLRVEGDRNGTQVGRIVVKQDITD